MKKWYSILLFLLLILPVPVLAEETAGTESSPEPPVTEHTHTWITETAAATCTQAGSVTQTCGCGAVTLQTLPATGHSWGEGTVTATPNCTTAGTKVYTCSCGAQQTETLPAVGHSFSAWTVSEQSHSRSCSCGVTEASGHSWDVSVTVPATCLEEGVKAYGCSTCGAEAYEVLPILNIHTYDNVCDPDCNVCGAVREASHKFSTVWSRNSKGHWHACSACGEQKDFGSHYPGPAATEEKAQICLTCGITMTPKLNHQHKYAAQRTGDESGHWFACSGCEEQKDFQEHAYDDSCDPDCNICGYVTATAHSYSGTWTGDESGHRDICTVCGEAGTPEPHIPGPEATETEAQVCSLCGYQLMPPQEHIHKEDGQWSRNEAVHWKRCNCGEEILREDHNWDEGTEQKDTTIRYTCKDCGAVRTEGSPEAGIPALLWIGIAVSVLLATAAAALLILIPRLKRGKYRN